MAMHDSGQSLFGGDERVYVFAGQSHAVPRPGEFYRGVSGIYGGAYLVGHDAQDAGFVMHLANSTFTTLYYADAGVALNDVWAGGANDVHVVGEMGQGGVILHFDGSTWSQSASATAPLNAVWGLSSSDVWAVGNGGLVLHWNGSSWAATASGTTQDLAAVWGAPSGEVYAAGKSGTLIKWNGLQWSPVSLPVTTDLTAVAGIDASRLLVAGKGGTLLVFTGQAWNSPTTTTLDWRAAACNQNGCGIVAADGTYAYMQF